MGFHEPIFNAEPPTLLIAAGVIFLAVSIIGGVSGRIQPGRYGRIAGGVVGIVFVVTGLVLYPAPSPNGDGVVTEPPDGDDNVVVTDTPQPDTPTLSPVPDTPTVTPEPEGFRVIEVFVRADPFDYTGACPVEITFSARISAIGGSGQVTYRWIRSDGANAPIRTIEFDEPGSKDIQSTWRLGGTGERWEDYEGWKAIRILEPNGMESERATFELHCT